MFIGAGENDNLIVQKLEANPNSVGIFGFSFLDQNADKIHGAVVDGRSPTFDAIAEGSYPVSRPLYFYVKKAHVGAVPGIKEYLAEFTSEGAYGEGLSVRKGPDPDAGGRAWSVPQGLDVAQPDECTLIDQTVTSAK